jgi:hypothetical protein
LCVVCLLLVCCWFALSLFLFAVCCYTTHTTRITRTPHTHRSCSGRSKTRRFELGSLSESLAGSRSNPYVQNDAFWLPG